MKTKLTFLLLVLIIFSLNNCSSIEDIPETILYPADSTNTNIFTANLSSPFPNPFESSTEVIITVPERAYTEVVVQNPVGDVIKVLMAQDIGAGSFSVTWDATNDDGKEVNEGYYIITFKSGLYQLSTTAKYQKP